MVTVNSGFVPLLPLRWPDSGALFLPPSPPLEALPLPSWPSRRSLNRALWMVPSSGWRSREAEEDLPLGMPRRVPPPPLVPELNEKDDVVV